MTYTDGQYIVADSLDELHKFCKSIGLKRSEHFTNSNAKCYYQTAYVKITDKAIAKGAKKITTRQVVEYSRKLPETEMYAGRIQEYLFKYFENYTYKLTNSIVTSWEADFFCKSDSGYFVETEIKISRSDYLRDFDKPKHKYFAALKAGKTVIVEPTQYGLQYPGDFLGRYIKPKIVMQYGPLSDYKRYGWGIGTEYWLREVHNGKMGFWVNDWGNLLYVEKKQKDVYAAATNIRFINLIEMSLPHQFYFCVPAGLIEKAEIPDYAGLFYVKDGQIKLIKKAPYLHKRKTDLTRTLLSKFYNLWAFKQDIYEKMEITNAYNEQIRDTGKEIS